MSQGHTATVISKCVNCNQPIFLNKDDHGKQRYFGCEHAPQGSPENLIDQAGAIAKFIASRGR